MQVLVSNWITILNLINTIIQIYTTEPYYILVGNNCALRVSSGLLPCEIFTSKGHRVECACCWWRPSSTLREAPSVALAVETRLLNEIQASMMALYFSPARQPERCWVGSGEFPGAAHSADGEEESGNRVRRAEFSFVLGRRFSSLLLLLAGCAISSHRRSLPLVGVAALNSNAIRTSLRGTSFLRTWAFVSSKEQT